MTLRGGGSDRAVIVRVSGPTATVCSQGELLEARLAPKLPGRPVVAGDRVTLRVDGDDRTVVGVAPRRTRLERGDGWERRPRMMAANADLLVVTASVVDPPLRPRLLDRYLVAAEVGGLEAAVAVTKTDLGHDADELGELAERYRGIGYPVLCGSAHSPEFVERIRALIAGRVAVLAGHSGVGKSTLTAALTGMERATGAVSDIGKGRHTTTDPRLIRMPGGGAIVDTAGVRTFHLPRMDRATLESGFPEIAAASTGCRFRGCAHDGDAGCAVAGHVHPARLESYLRLLHDLR
ncbi:MAG: ribosome small subunit-dependent GTPase A [Thermoleophilia bacterium]